MNSLCVLTFTCYNCYYYLQFNSYNLMEISSDALFLLSEDFKISILSRTKWKTDGSRKEKRLCMCRLCKPLKILFSAKCRIETDILYFPLNYTSSNIHFEQFEILTSSLASHHRKKKINERKMRISAQQPWEFRGLSAELSKRIKME